MEHPDNPVLLYITDPMCTWCYGFTPVVRRLKALWRDRITIKTLFGGLNPFPAEPLSHEQKEQMAVAWHRVQQRTGLPFDYRFFLWKDYFYNTEPACRALLCVRLLRPGLTMEVFRAMASAFHAGNRDITQTHELVKIAELFGIRENLFLTLFESEEIADQLQEEFDFVRELGVSNYPSLLLQKTAGTQVIAKGYCELPVLEERLLESLQTAHR